MLIAENLHKIKESLSDKVTLVAVSKTKPVSDIETAYNAGHRDFGENKIQEMTAKYEVLPKDIHWHMIGHLQRNKIKYMAHFVHLIHGVDSLKTLKEIDKQAKKHDRVIHCLLQAKIAQEDTKFGMAFDDLETLLNSQDFLDLKNVQVDGLMGMASFTEDKEQIRAEFKRLNNFFEHLSKEINLSNFKAKTLSMGMSSDYQIAIEEGSTMIRVGSAIFGLRNYVTV
jgi:pyridoxal phosphate enzyme (YggS family)